MNLSSFVSKNMVAVNLRASTKRAVIAEIVGYICSRLSLPNRNQILQAVLEREEKASTGIGEGVAIPHSRLPRLEQVLFFVGISKPGIDFGAPDGKAAHIIFLFVTPEAESQTHLKILSAIGNLQKNTALLEKLIGSASDTELFNTLNYEQVQRESYYPLSREEVFRELETSEGGLSEYEARARTEIYGHNRLLTIGATPLLALFLRNLVDVPNLLLWVAVLLGFLSGLFWVASVVVVLSLLNACFAFVREYKGDRAVDALKKLVPQVSRVIRAGRERKINTENLVPGDILLLDEGDIIPADGRLIEANELRVDNSAFSGDPKPVYKSHNPIENREQFLWIEMPALVFAGTTVIAGSGKAVITSTGMDTELGQIAYLTQTIKGERSSLERGISRFARVSGLTTLILLGIAAALILIRGETLLSQTDSLVAVGIILGLSAEGLIPAVTLALVAAAARMKRRGAIIKRLSSIETIGATDVVCTDKTGTLTTGEMCVRRLWLGGRILEVEGDGYAPVGDFRHGQGKIAGVDLGNSDYRIFFYDAVLCNNANLIPPAGPGDKWLVEGDPTEGALLAVAAKAEIDVETIRRTYPATRRFPFDSVRKRMSTVHATGPLRGDKHTHHLLVKGAPHELLALSTRVLLDGKERVIDSEIRRSIDDQIDRFAADGMRVLGFAYRGLGEGEFEDATVDEVERDLVYVGVSAMIDPPRPDARESIRSCRDAGIRVVMITGEYQVTALSIARKLGIVESPNARVISGKALSESTDEEIRLALEKDEIVFARVNPEHRLRLVRILKQMGYLVAVTGDGISDAPVLKKADIGVAMGGRGNPVTQSAAEMVLSGDSFASIVAAIEEGRGVCANIRRMTSFIASHLLPEAISFLVFIMLGVPLPLSLGLLLLIDLVVDLLPALAIGAGTPARRSMRGGLRLDRIVDGSTIGRDFVFHGLLVSAVALAGFFVSLGGDGTAHLAFDLRPGSVFFLGVVAAQLALYASQAVATVAAHRRKIGTIVLLTAGAACAVGIVALVSYLPALSRTFHTAAFLGRDWITGVVMFGVAYAGSQLWALFARRRTPGSEMGKVS